MKEYILFALIFFIGFVFCLTVFDFFYSDGIDIVRVVITGGIVTFLLLLDKIYKFSDKIKQKLTFIK